MSRHEITQRAATAGAEVAHDLFRTELDVGTKDSSMDFVTRADTETQRRVIDTILDAYPDATVVGEEGDELKSVPADGSAWVVDPIDGTSNFVHGIQLWTTTVAAIRDGKTVGATTVAPALGDTYTAGPDSVTLNDEPMSVSGKADVEEFKVASILRYGPERDHMFGELLDTLMQQFGDLRRFGCAQVTLGMVACGSLDAAISTQPQPNPWDTIAGVFLVERAGGTVTDIYGDPWTPDAEGLVASNGKSHKAAVERVVDIVD
ncbi:inositol monophosphatase family protein [Haloarcula amylovorans]|uniref:inositol monophosphatase family protein n=1 Tax=Haloarcula amylovorans TaxID=2562280 RepID=UPI00107614DB|nr:inositol monophosphatase [Halomicroarcula amylolytica]